MKRRRGLAGSFARRTSRPGPRRLNVEQCEDRLLLASYIVSNNLDSGAGSLRDAINQANSNASADNQITFALTATQPITPTTALPAITDPGLVIDGRIGSSGRVEINGTALPTDASGVSGLTVAGNANNVILRNLTINRFRGNGISLGGAGGSAVLNSYIGVDPSGLVASGNIGNGISVTSPNNTIGGTNATDRNVIASNTAVQITLSSGASNTTILGNYIGTNATGSAALAPTQNIPDGIQVNSANNTIGGTGGGRNLISGNNNGISVLGGTGTVVLNNYIGTDITGATAIANLQYGVLFTGVRNNTIGGTNTGEGNLISGNTIAGIRVENTATGTGIFGNQIGLSAQSTTSGIPNGVGAGAIGGISLFNASGVFIGFATNQPSSTPNSASNTIAFNNPNGIVVNGGASDAILTNSIFSNTAAGISLQNNGNNNAQAPFLTSVDTTATTALIQGQLIGRAGQRYRVQFFSALNQADANNSGRQFIGEADITANTAFTTFAVSIPAVVAANTYITATATEQATNNTSPFSSSVQSRVSQTPDLGVSIDIDPNPPLTGQALNYTITVTNTGQNTASNVVLSQTLPAGVQYSTNGGLTFQTSTTAPIQISLGDVARNDTREINLTVLAPVTLSSITTSAVLTSDTPETNNANNSASRTDNFAAVADLAVFLTPPSDRIPLQSTASYVVTVVNSGPNIAGNAVVEVTLPASLTSITTNYDPSRVTISKANDGSNVVTINLGVRPSPDSLQIMVSGVATQVGTFAASARVFESNGEFDSDTTNNVAPVAGGTPITITVANAADLDISVGATPNPVLIGGTLTYSITVRNGGPSTASTPIVSLTIPNGLVFDQSASNVSPSQVTLSGNTLSVALNAINAGDASTFTLGFSPTQPGLITSTFTVSNPSDVDTNPSNDTASSTVAVAPSNLAVSVVAPNGALGIGTPATFQIVVTNNGPGSAPNVALANVFTPGLGTFNGLSFSRDGITAQNTNNTINASIGTLAPNETVVITVGFIPAKSGVLTTTNQVTTTGFDPDTTNNTATSTSLLSPVNLVVTTTTTPGPVLLGQPVTYLVTVTNQGPANATNVILTNVVPAGVTSVIVGLGQQIINQNNPVVLNLGDLASGSSTTVALTVTPTSTGTATNTASVTSDNIDTDPASDTSTSAVAIFNVAGTFNLTSNIAQVNETAGQVTFTVTRTDGSLGTASVGYFTTDGTAIAGVNYTATQGTLVFASGETSKTITVPILRDRAITPNLQFQLSLTNPSTGALIGAVSSAVVQVINTDFDVIAPQVVSVQPIQTGAGIIGFVVSFNEAMDPTRAQIASNYAVTLSGRDPGRGAGNPVQVSSVAYADFGTSHTATILLSNPLPSNRFYQLNLNGTFGLALTDTSGNLLDGLANGGSGTNYVTTIGQGTTLRYVDGNRNVVTITLRRGGTMTIIRNALGNTTSINLQNIVPRRSILSGSVQRPRGSTSGRVSIGVVTGLRRFGDVRSNLTTAPFFATFAPVVVNGEILTSNVTPARATASSTRAVVSAAVPARPASF